MHIKNGRGSRGLYTFVNKHFVIIMYCFWKSSSVFNIFPVNYKNIKKKSSAVEYQVR